MKTKLIFPAFWTCSAPYLSVPSLAAYLKSHNKDVEQIDLNLEFFDKLLSKDFIDLCLEKYKAEMIDIKDTCLAPYFSTQKPKQHHSKKSNVKIISP